MAPKPKPCPLNGDAHRWQPGPVVAWRSPDREGPRWSQRAASVLALCECGEATLVPVPAEG